MYSVRGDKSLYYNRLNCSAASSGSALQIDTTHGNDFRCVANPYSKQYIPECKLTRNNYKFIMGFRETIPEI